MQPLRLKYVLRRTHHGCYSSIPGFSVSQYWKIHDNNKNIFSETDTHVPTRPACVYWPSDEVNNQQTTTTAAVSESSRLLHAPWSCLVRDTVARAEIRRWKKKTRFHEGGRGNGENVTKFSVPHKRSLPVGGAAYFVRRMFSTFSRRPESNTPANRSAGRHNALGYITRI